jgi:hypothetical protein
MQECGGPPIFPRLSISAGRVTDDLVQDGAPHDCLARQIHPVLVLDLLDCGVDDEPAHSGSDLRLPGTKKPARWRAQKCESPQRCGPFAEGFFHS